MPETQDPPGHLSSEASTTKLGKCQCSNESTSSKVSSHGWAKTQEVPNACWSIIKGEDLDEEREGREKDKIEEDEDEDEDEEVEDKDADGDKDIDAIKEGEDKVKGVNEEGRMRTRTWGVSRLQSMVLVIS